MIASNDHCKQRLSLKVLTKDLNAPVNRILKECKH